MRMNKRLLFGIISIALAAVIALIGIPAVIGQSNTKINIVRVKEAIEEGTVVTAEQLEMAEVSSHGLPANVATDFTQVVGTYALVDLVPGDYFLPTKVSTESPEKDTILKKLTGDKIAVSMSVQSLAGVLSNKLRTDDIVSVYSYEDGEVVKVEELQYVRIIAVTNSNGTNIEDAVGDESRMAATITFLSVYRSAGVHLRRYAAVLSGSKLRPGGADHRSGFRHGGSCDHRLYLPDHRSVYAGSHRNVRPVDWHLFR